MTAPSPLDRIEARARDYVRTDDFPDGWIEPHEVTDASSPDLTLFRDVLALVEIAKAAEPFAEGAEAFDHADSTYGDAPVFERLANWTRWGFTLKDVRALRAALDRLEQTEA